VVKSSWHISKLTGFPSISSLIAGNNSLSPGSPGHPEGVVLHVFILLLSL